MKTPSLVSLLAIGLLAIAPLTSALAQSGASVEDQLKESSSGIGRFRGGVYAAAGWGFGSKIEDAKTGGTRPSGLALDIGLYGIFNPIRDFADIEAGLGLRGILSTTQYGSGSGNSYKSGYISPTVYTGPIFRFGDGGSNAIAFGAQLDFSASILSDDADPFYKKYSGKMKPALGIYGEYQYKKIGDENKTIYYTRLNAYRYDVKFDNAPTPINSQGKGNTLVTLIFGIKY